MKTIAIYNNKGGVGKTTSTINIAHRLSTTNNQRVLVIDCDGQQNASRFFVDTLSECGFENALLNGDEINPTPTRYKNIDVVISTSNMNFTAQQFAQLDESTQVNNLKKIISSLRAKPYDYVLLDLPPALNNLTEKLLGISDGVVVPIELGTFAIQGIANVTNVINSVGSSFIGCFVSKYDKKNSADEKLFEMLKQSLGTKVFENFIPYSKVIKNSITYRMTAFEYMKWTGAVKSYKALTKELIERIN